MPPLGYRKIKCGTAPGYDLHRRNGEPPCLECRIARAQKRQDERHAVARRQELLEALAGFDRYPTGQRPTVAISVYPTVSRDTSRALGSELDADGCPPYGWRREFLAEWDGVA